MSEDSDDIDASSSDRDDRLAQIVAAYSADLEAGRRPDRRALLKQHPDLAADLSACLGGLNFLNSAANQLAATAMDAGDVTAGGPQPLGDYKLLREIGRGGMGVVYEAEQLSLARRVAVKVLPMAAAMDERQLQRFRNEAAAAAQLHHTNIVPVYAVGCERSMHFYAMQLIDGQSLADVIRDLKAGAAEKTDFASSADLSFSPPSQSLTTQRATKRHGFYETVARLGLQAAEALHHAHHAGIVHRDIKPANLLLDGRQNVWITDFGLAQFYSAENDLTASTDRPGTLRYMSPEQASGRAVVLDQRTDIYSLGVTLYELLTLEKAVAGDTREQIQQNLSASDVRPARAIDPQVPKELETILATATAKEPLDRYATAGALAEDLRRFLTDQPILAKPPGLGQLMVRWVRRHRTLAWSAIVMLLVLTAAFAVSTVLIALAKAKADEAARGERVQAQVARTQQMQAEESYAEARDAVNFFTRIAVNEMSSDRPSPEIRRWMLEAAHDYYAKFRNDHQNDPASARDLEQAQATINSVLTELQSVERGFRLRTLLRLMQNPAVAKEIDLTPDQADKAKALYATMDGNTGDGPPPPPDTAGFRQQIAKAGEQADKAVKDLLTAAQYQRLSEITRQVRGPAAFFDADLVRDLVLTPTQKDALRPLLTAYRGAFRRPGPPDMVDDQGQTRAQMRAKTMASIVQLLDPYQKAAWQAMLGKPFPDAERLDQDGPGGWRHRFGGFMHGPGPDDRGPPDDGPPPGAFGF